MSRQNKYVDEVRERQWQIIRKILTYLKQYRAFLFISLFLAALTVVLTLLIPIFIGDAVDLLLAGKGAVDIPAVLEIAKLIAIVMVETAIYFNFH